MIDPVLALQTAIHDHLISDVAVTALVPVAHIRAGSTRPDKLPTIIIADGTTTMHGRAAGSQFVASVFLDLHIWSEADGLATAKQIGAAVARRLMDWPATIGFALDEFKHTRTVWPRDPDQDYGHGVVSLEAAIRWSI
ncbi:MAG: DUF3168 domain-containing protein [Mesorhizobium sp.]